MGKSPIKFQPAYYNSIMIFSHYYHFNVFIINFLWACIEQENRSLDTPTFLHQRMKWIYIPFIYYSVRYLGNILLGFCSHNQYFLFCLMFLFIFYISLCVYQTLCNTFLFYLRSIFMALLSSSIYFTFQWTLRVWI